MREHWKVEGSGPSRVPRYAGAPVRVAGPSPASLLADVRCTFTKLPGWHQECSMTDAWRLSVIREKSAGEAGSGLSRESSARKLTPRTLRRRGSPPRAGMLPSRAGWTHLTVLPVAFLGPRAARKGALESTPASLAFRCRPDAQAVGQPPRLDSAIGRPIARNVLNATPRGAAPQGRALRRTFFRMDRGRVRAAARVKNLFCEKFLHGKDFAGGGFPGPRALRSPGKSRKALEWKVEG